jgi:hypothetical protein
LIFSRDAEVRGFRLEPIKVRIGRILKTVFLDDFADSKTMLRGQGFKAAVIVVVNPSVKTAWEIDRPDVIIDKAHHELIKFSDDFVIR